MALAPPRSLDRDGKPLNVGDHVSFVMRGFFHPREQECYGKIEAIDQWGGVTIQPVAPYKHFLSSKKIGEHAKSVYFTHHRYDAAQQARVYSLQQDGHSLYISVFSEP